MCTAGGARGESAEGKKEQRACSTWPALCRGVHQGVGDLTGSIIQDCGLKELVSDLGQLQTAV